jgi:hypothetical protein
LGAGWSEEEAAHPLIFELRGLRLGLLNYVTQDTHPNLPTNARVHLNWFEEKRALSETSALSHRVDAVLVHLHWGEEFIRMPSIDQRRIARKLVEAGARVVVGGHPHVLQGHESWTAGYIFHGVGNFLFWPPKAPLDPSHPWPRYIREAGVASCRFTERGIRDIRIRHFVQDGLSLHLDQTPRRMRTERRLCRSLQLSDRSFARARRMEAFYTEQLLSRIHGMRQAGGFWPWMVARCLRKARQPASRKE